MRLHGSPDNFYVSFSGNVYQKKLDFFGQTTNPTLRTNVYPWYPSMRTMRQGFDVLNLKLLQPYSTFNPNVYFVKSSIATECKPALLTTPKKSGSIDQIISPCWRKIIQPYIEWRSLVEF